MRAHIVRAKVLEMRLARRPFDERPLPEAKTSRPAVLLRRDGKLSGRLRINLELLGSRWRCLSETPAPFLLALAESSVETSAAETGVLVTRETGCRSSLNYVN